MNGLPNGDSEDSEDAYVMEEFARGEQQQEADPDSHGPHSQLDARMGSVPPPAMTAVPPVRKNRDGRGNYSSSNTGPKGVKADYEEAKFQLRTIRMHERMARDKEVSDMANGRKRFVMEEPQLPPPKKRGSGSESESDSDLVSDDEEFQRYKLERLKLVEASLPAYGIFDRVTKAEMAAEIHDAHELCFVIIHLYQNHIAACTALNLCFENLAPQFVRARFLRIRSDEAISGYSDAGLPTVLIYRGGELVSEHVRILNEIGSTVTDATVAQWLANKGVLSMPTRGLEKQQKSGKLKVELRRGGASEGSDSEIGSGSDYEKG
jgi:hypothetical protein